MNELVDAYNSIVSREDLSLNEYIASISTVIENYTYEYKIFQSRSADFYAHISQNEELVNNITNGNAITLKRNIKETEIHFQYVLNNMKGR